LLAGIKFTLGWVNSQILCKPVYCSYVNVVSS